MITCFKKKKVFSLLKMMVVYVMGVSGVGEGERTLPLKYLTPSYARESCDN
jgi:hypothetical protein